MNRYKAQRAYLKYLAPTMLVIFLLTLIPIAVTVVLSLTSLSYRSAKPSEFVGIQNYVRLFSDDRFLNSIPTSIILIVVPVAAQLILGFIVAIVMHEKLPWMGWLRIIFVAPMVLPPIVMGLMWRILFTPQLGGVNYFLSLIGVGGPEWLSEPTFALLAVIVAAVWGWTPFVGLMFLTSIQTLPCHCSDQLYLLSAFSASSKRWPSSLSYSF
jgi:multiple sugar transport system permease protein